MHPIAIAFCADKMMESALHVAMRSALVNLKPGCCPHIYAMVEHFSSADRARLARTLDATGRKYDLTYLEPDPDMFASLPALHGNRSCYFRLLLPELVQEDRLLYLDSDILIRCDLSPLFELDMKGSALGAIVGGTAEFTLDKELRLSLDQSLTDPAFNSGVLLFDCLMWRRQQLLKECVRFGLEYRNEIRVVDQTILNVLFATSCIHLPNQYNTAITSRSEHIPSEAVLHYIGSPKPWDLGAASLLPYAKAWFLELRMTAIPLRRRIPWLTLSTWRRFPKILGGYRRLAVQRMQG
ncbi:glycosyltransferase family 8 protein [Acidicapsa acidisoli]|uniref:glycosyltransferase family 8 protein n=1 Tax=Acidicapsa acidisoli TaxID=1615681 RepID=UPI0021E02C8B|nr:glycosyltransferase family 8 protein [Acidicapsa acidisoli]